MKPKTAYSYRARVVRWIDGDTLDVVVDLGFEVSIAQRVRLAGIDTPELRSADAGERKRAELARGLAETLAPPGVEVQLNSEKPAGGDKFGRYLATVATADGEFVARVLLSKGLAAEYFGGKK